MRTHSIKHPSGFEVRTPVLVPSFSSRGFRFAKGKSEADFLLGLATNFLTESCLISAYDIKHRHIPSAAKLPFQTKLTFVDSGGYETGVSHDLTNPYQFTASVRKWSRRDYLGMLDNWPASRDAVFISYDSRKKIRNQVSDAEALARRYKKQLTCFLIKPPYRAKQGLITSAFKEIEQEVGRLQQFPIIGVTEKELGVKLIDRLCAVHRLRSMLDQHGVQASIHVFGSLDPMSVKLYFLAGAEIFDGLAWLRFGFSKQGESVYMPNWNALESLESEDDSLRALMMARNYIVIQELQLDLRAFASSRNWDKFGAQKDMLKRAYEAVQAI